MDKITLMKKFKKVGNDIINSEGSILALYVADNQMYLSSFLDDGSGKIYFQVSTIQLCNLLLSNNTIKQIFDESPIYYCVRNETSRTSIRNQLREMLTCGDILMKNIPPSMIDSEWLKNLIMRKP